MQVAVDCIEGFFFALFISFFLLGNEMVTLSWRLKVKSNWTNYQR